MPVKFIDPTRPNRLGCWSGLAPLGRRARTTHMGCRARLFQVCVDGLARPDKVIGLVDIARVIEPIELV